MWAASEDWIIDFTVAFTAPPARVELILSQGFKSKRNHVLRRFLVASYALCPCRTHTKKNRSAGTGSRCRRRLKMELCGEPAGKTHAIDHSTSSPSVQASHLELDVIQPAISCVSAHDRNSITLSVDENAQPIMVMPGRLGIGCKLAVSDAGQAI